MVREINLSNEVRCYTEHAPLQRVVLCPPQYMIIREVINVTQEHYAEENINTPRALKQHENLLKTFKEQGVHVDLLPVHKELPEQVFTRDIAFSYGEQVIVGSLQEKIRQGEEKVLVQWLEENHIPYSTMKSGSIECGDVIIDGNTIWVGQSYRTSKDATLELQELLPDVEIIPIPFEEDYLHLDCVFNLLSDKEGLVFPPAFEPEVLEKLTSRYDLIEVSHREQFSLGTNVLSIGEKKVISLPQNKEVNQKLRDRGYKVIEVDISEIIKSGGSFRCITMPMIRG